jgi:hypothetical protein
MHVQSQRASNLTSYFLPDGQLMRIDFSLPKDAGGLDAVHQASMFAERARAHAKTMSREVRQQFFSEEVRPFTPVPLPKSSVISTLQPAN